MARIRLARRIVWALLICAIMGGCEKGSPVPERIPGLCIVDSTVPNTEVFLRGQKLGVTPLRLEKERLSELGLTEPIGMDGLCEGCFFGIEHEQEERVMLRVPDAQADEFQEIETPWGRRTKIFCMSSDWTASNTSLFEMMRTGSFDDNRSLRLTLSSLDATRSGEGDVALDVTCSNVSSATVEAEAASITAYWGTFDTPWWHRSCRKTELNSDWLSIAPNTEKRVQIAIPTPSVSEDYSVFVTLWLEGTDLGGAVYSNSRWLRVR